MSYMLLTDKAVCLTSTKLPNTFVDLTHFFTPACLAAPTAVNWLPPQMKLNKSSTRTQLTDDHLEAVMCFSATSIKLDISKLVADMQHYPSH